MSNPLDIKVGQVYGCWTVISSAPSTLDGKRRSLCKCICGIIKEVNNSYLKDGRSTRCNGHHNLPRKKRINSTHQKEIAIRYVEGESSVKLGNEFNISSTSVLNYVKKFGYKTRDNIEVGNRKKKSIGVAAFNQTFKAKKALAKYRELEWNLTKDEFKQLVEKNCHYCGSAPKNIKKTCNGCYIHNGLDRINSDLGYDLNNVVPCCIICNRAKSNLTQIEFQNWINALICHQNKR